MKIYRLLTIFVLLVFGCSACSTIDVKPWQKGYLAKNEMLISPDPIDSSIRGHTFSSKEAATGGHSVGAGGCGCN